MKAIQLATVAALLLSAGCARQAIYQRTAEFREDEYAPFGKPGTARISGQAFLKTRGGDVKLGAGNQVFLNPKTSYSQEWFEQHVLAGKQLSDPDERARKYQRIMTADAQGGFSFDGLPAGEYFVACPIFWSTGSSTTGGWAFSRTTVTDGQQAIVVVTR